jgi:hypothetical protein
MRIVPHEVSDDKVGLLLGGEGGYRFGAGVEGGFLLDYAPWIGASTYYQGIRFGPKFREALDSGSPRLAFWEAVALETYIDSNPYAPWVLTASAGVSVEFGAEQ